MNYAIFIFTFHRLCIIIVSAVSGNALLYHDTRMNDNEGILCCNLKN